MTSWEDLTERRKAPRPAEPDDYSDVAAAALSSPAGRLLLEHLEAIYLRAVLSPGASESALREHNAKRHLVQELKLKMELGLAAKRKAHEARKDRSSAGA